MTSNAEDSTPRPDRRRRTLAIRYGALVLAVAVFAVAWLVPLLPMEGDQLTVTFTRGGGVVESVDGSTSDLTPGTALRAGDRVVIPEGASVSFASVEGHDVTLSDSSSLGVEGSRRSLLGGRTRTTIGVDQGEARVRGRGRPGTSLDVGLPNGVAGVRGTDFGVSVRGGRSAVSVHEGRVGLSATGGGSTDLSPGQGALITASGARVVDLPPAPRIRLLGADEALVRSPGTVLSWTSVSGAAGYAYQIAADTAFQDVRVHGRTDSAFVEIPILDFDEPLFTRVQAITSDGLRGPPSSAYGIQIAFHWAQGRRLREQGDVQGSLGEFQLALERHSENADLHRDLGWSYYVLGRHRQARTAYERARELAPDDHEMLIELARINFWLADYREAEAIYREVLEARPQYADALWGLGDTYRVMGRRAEALDLVRRALEADPNHPYARSTLRELQAGG